MNRQVQSTLRPAKVNVSQLTMARQVGKAIWPANQVARPLVGQLGHNLAGLVASQAFKAWLGGQDGG